MSEQVDSVYACNDHPCQGCTINCCAGPQWTNVLITKEEYERLFSHHVGKFSLREAGNYYILSGEGRDCPYLADGGYCRIHDERPIDCRLYPFIMRHIFERRNGVRIVFHSRAGTCPQKDTLLKMVPEAEARALIMSFARQVYGEDKNIIIQREIGIIARLRNRFESVIDGLKRSK